MFLNFSCFVWVQYSLHLLITLSSLLTSLAEQKLDQAGLAHREDDSALSILVFIICTCDRLPPTHISWTESRCGSALDLSVLMTADPVMTDQLAMQCLRRKPKARQQWAGHCVITDGQAEPVLTWSKLSSVPPAVTSSYFPVYFHLRQWKLTAQGIKVPSCTAIMSRWLVNRQCRKVFHNTTLATGKNAFSDGVLCCSIVSYDCRYLPGSVYLLISAKRRR